MKKATIIFPLLLLLLFALPIATHAYELKTGTSINLGQDEIIDGNFYAAGNFVTIDGIINGDAYVAGQNVNINGTIEGDLFVAGENVTINGPVGSSLRVAGANIMINNEVKHGVHAFGASINLSKDASVGWDFFIAGAIGDIQGKVGGDLHGAAENIIIGGEVGKNVKLRLDERLKNEQASTKSGKALEIQDTAIIGGSVYYTAGQEGVISSNASVGGEVSHSVPAKSRRHDNTLAQVWGGLFSIFSSLVVGLVLISLWREKIIELSKLMREKIGPSIGWGVVIMFVAPIIAFILLITIIGIPLAIILIMIWLIALYLSKILLGIMIGRELMKRWQKEKKESLIWAMIIGVVTVSLLTSFPIIGWILSLVAIWWGLGSVWLMLKKS